MRRMASEVPSHSSILPKWLQEAFQTGAVTCSAERFGVGGHPSDILSDAGGPSACSIEGWRRPQEAMDIVFLRGCQGSREVHRR